MDTLPLVEMQIADGRRMVERFGSTGQLRTAFWGLDADSGRWFIYFVTELADTHGSAAAYRAIFDAVQNLPTHLITVSEVKAIGVHHPAARVITAGETDRSPHYPVWLLGNLALAAAGIDQAYVYQQDLISGRGGNGMTTDEVGRELIRLLNRTPGGNPSPSKVSLRDGTNFNGVPFSLQHDSQRSAVVQFIADGEPTLRTVPLNDIASIA